MATNESTSISDLPNEVLTLIFENLTVRDVIRCSLVCKRFKLLCQNIKIPELIISNTTENIKHYWFHTNKQFNLQDAIDCSTFNEHRSLFKLDKFKRLYFGGCKSEYDQLKVNDLAQLEQVKICVEEVTGASNEIHINLPNLRIIQIVKDDSRVHSNMFVITTPKLEMLRCLDFDDIRLTYPNTVKHMETELFREKFLVLKNLQFLQVNLGFPAEIVWPNFFRSFPKLITLASSESGCLRSMKTLINLVKKKLRLQRPGLKIYFQSVEINDIEKIREYSVTADEFFFQIKNYDSLAEIVACNYEIRYDDLLFVMGTEIPNNFHKKYFKTQCISVLGNVENPEHLFEFLKNYDYLTELSLNSVSLDQLFYNKLDKLDQLTDLSIYNSKSICSFDFLLELKQLKHFQTDSDSLKLFDLTLALFRHLKHFRHMLFNFERRLFIVDKRKATNDYSINRFGYENCQFDFDELAREMESIKGRHINQD